MKKKGLNVPNASGWHNRISCCSGKSGCGLPTRRNKRLENGCPNEVCGLPPIRQKKGEWMGHGAFVAELAQSLGLPGQRQGAGYGKGGFGFGFGFLGLRAGEGYGVSALQN